MHPLLIKQVPVQPPLTVEIVCSQRRLRNTINGMKKLTNYVSMRILHKIENLELIAHLVKFNKRRYHNNGIATLFPNHSPHIVYGDRRGT